MNCPVCNIKLLMTERFGDYCSQCGVIWIEKGAFDRISDRTFIEIPTKATIQNREGNYGRRDDRGHEIPHDDHYARYKKNSDFLH
jgi:Zn-finger nucleic acid-binding protein